MQIVGFKIDFDRLSEIRICLLPVGKFGDDVCLALFVGTYESNPEPERIERRDRGIDG